MRYSAVRHDAFGAVWRRASASHGTARRRHVHTADSLSYTLRRHSVNEALGGCGGGGKLEARERRAMIVAACVSVRRTDNDDDDDVPTDVTHASQHVHSRRVH